MSGDSFKEYKEHTLFPQVSDVLPSYPPAYIVGQLLHEPSRIVLEKDSEMATVTLEEVSCEYMYSNPQGMFNLSTPEKLWRTP